MLPLKIKEATEFLVKGLCKDKRGPWTTKAGGNLSVLFSVEHNWGITGFFDYDERAMRECGRDIRGLRIYENIDLMRGRTAGMEFHKIRKEIICVTAGKVRWVCEDLFGGIREFVMSAGASLYVPPTILHTCHIEEDNSGFTVICNTSFDPDDPATHDTYPESLFRDLQLLHKI